MQRKKYHFPKIIFAAKYAFLGTHILACRLIWCPVGWLVGGCGARAVRHLFTVLISLKIPTKLELQSRSDHINQVHKVSVSECLTIVDNARTWVRSKSYQMTHIDFFQSPLLGVTYPRNVGVGGILRMTRWQGYKVEGG